MDQQKKPWVAAYVPLLGANGVRNRAGAAGVSRLHLAAMTAPTMLLLCSLLQVCAFGPSVVSSGQRHAVGNMSLTLSETQTIETLTVPAADLAGGRFDFMPNATSFRGSHHLGDVTMRVRVVGTNSSFSKLTTGGSLAAKAAPLPTPPVASHPTLAI